MKQYSEVMSVKDIPNFEQLSDSIAMTKQMLEETSDTFAALDSHNRDMAKFELLLSNSSSSK